MKTLKIIITILSLPFICIYAAGYMVVMMFAIIIGGCMDEIGDDPTISEWVIKQIES